jgi:hypothetical protein
MMGFPVFLGVIMSTTFAVYVDNEPIEVARRIGIGNGEVDFVWLNKLGPLLDDRTRVHPTDNNAQNVYYIRDIKTVIAKNTPKGRALRWWTSLSYNEQDKLCKKYFPTMSSYLVIGRTDIQTMHQNET